MNTLEIYAEFVNWIFIVYLIIAALNIKCFETNQWVLTFIILAFTYFMRYVSKIEDTKE